MLYSSVAIQYYSKHVKYRNMRVIGIAIFAATHRGKRIEAMWNSHIRAAFTSCMRRTKEQDGEGMGLLLPVAVLQ